MLLMCPSCHSLVEMTEVTDGKVRCPLCRHEFAAPTRYEPEVLGSSSGSSAGSKSTDVTSRPASAAAIAPPLVAPPAGAASFSSGVNRTDSASASGTRLPSPPLPEGGYAHAISITLSPTVVAWAPAVLLTLALLCTFFPWVGMFVGGAAVYRQTPWSALVGTVSTNYSLAEATHWNLRWLDHLHSDWGLLLPALTTLVLATLLAWADRSLKVVDWHQVPPLARFWPYRRWILLALVTITAFLLVSQTLYGLGMERAVHAAIVQQFADEMREAGDNSVKQAIVHYRMEQELRRYNLEYTLWQRLGVLAVLLALLSLVVDTLLQQRGTLPPPRLVLQY
ncbi:MAG: zinc-ribbon domain-containing protein [Gemmataceae bacterium]|nr:zinc-ribbon domain-containing protein [Gemmataceae bacterium]